MNEPLTKAEIKRSESANMKGIKTYKLYRRL